MCIRDRITTVTKQAIQGLMQRDYQVILASGRPTAGMRRYEEELELEKYGGYLLSFNGAKVIECRSGEVVYQRLLPLTFIPGLYDFAKKNHCGLITYLGDEVISAFPIDKYVEIESRINGIPVRRVENFVDFVDFDINKCLMTAEPARAAILAAPSAPSITSDLPISKYTPNCSKSSCSSSRRLLPMLSA